MMSKDEPKSQTMTGSERRNFRVVAEKGNKEVDTKSWKLKRKRDNESEIKENPMKR